MNTCLSLGEIMCVIVARRIARLAQVDPEAAQDLFLMRRDDLPEDEREVFEDVYVGCLIELGS